MPTKWPCGCYGMRQKILLRVLKGRVLDSKDNSVFEIQPLPLTSLVSLLSMRTTKKIKDGQVPMVGCSWERVNNCMYYMAYKEERGKAHAGAGF